jgi:hypothetical protein
MVIEPAVEVKAVVGASAPEPEYGNPELGKERDADAQVGRGLRPRKAAHRGQGEERREFFLTCSPGCPSALVAGGLGIGFRPLQCSWLHERARAGNRLRLLIVRVEILIAELFQGSLQERPAAVIALKVRLRDEIEFGHATEARIGAGVRFRGFHGGSFSGCRKRCGNRKSSACRKLRSLRTSAPFVLFAHPIAIERGHWNLAFLRNDAADRITMRAPAVIGGAVAGVQQAAALVALADQPRGAVVPCRAERATAKTGFAGHRYSPERR